MFTIIAVLLPSVLGVKLIDYLYKGLNLKRSLYFFVSLLLISSFINNFLVCVLFKIDSGILVYLNDLPFFFCKYVLISLIINILFALLIVVMMKNVSLEVEVLDEKDKKVKKTKKNSKSIKRVSKKASSK